MPKNELVDACCQSILNGEAAVLPAVHSNLNMKPYSTGNSCGWEFQYSSVSEPKDAAAESAELLEAFVPAALENLATLWKLTEEQQTWLKETGNMNRLVHLIHELTQNAIKHGTAGAQETPTSMLFLGLRTERDGTRWISAQTRQSLALDGSGQQQLQREFTQAGKAGAGGGLSLIRRSPIWFPDSTMGLGFEEVGGKQCCPVFELRVPIPSAENSEP